MCNLIKRPNRIAKTVAIILLTFLCIVIVQLYANYQWSNKWNNTRQINVGMNKKQVIMLLGKANIDHNRDSGETQKSDIDWLYYRPFTVCPSICLYFKEIPKKPVIFIELKKNKVTTVERQPDYKIRFDQNDWKMSTGARRHCMVESFIKKYSNVNLTKQDIIGLLGNPDNIDSISGELEYDLGEEWEYASSQHDVLVIYYKNNIISSYKLIRR